MAAWAAPGASFLHGGQFSGYWPGLHAVAASLYHIAFQYGTQHIVEIALSKRDVAMAAAAEQQPKA
jgi:hypothetical protein